MSDKKWRGGRLLLVDSPGWPLEDMLPQLRQVARECVYLNDVKQLTGPEARPEALIVSSELPGGPQGEGFLRLRRIFPRQPLLVLARNRSLAVALGFFRAGARDFLAAPVDVEELRERLAAALSEVDYASADQIPTILAEPVADGPAEPAGRAAGADEAWAENLPGGLIRLDAAGEVLTVNGEARRLLGRGPDAAEFLEFWRGGLAELFPLDARRNPLPPERWPPRAAAREKRRSGALLNLKCGACGRRWLRVEAQPQLNGEELTGVLVVLSTPFTFREQDDFGLAWSREFLAEKKERWREMVDNSLTDRYAEFVAAGRRAVRFKLSGQNEDLGEILEFMDSLWDKMTPPQRLEAEQALREAGLIELADQVAATRRELGGSAG